MNICAFTTVYNDPFMETWLKHYGKTIDDLYVINHGGDRGALEELQKKYKFEIIDDPRGTVRQSTLADSPEFYACLHQKELLKTYEYVVYAHADEIIIPDPNRYSGLRDYIEKMNKDFVFCTARTVLCIDEPKIDFSKPLLSQRKWWWPDTAYNKPLISKIPLNWQIGIHTIAEIPDIATKYVCDNDLYLIHLNQIDFDIFMERSGWRSKDYFTYGENERVEIPDKFKDKI